MSFHLFGVITLNYFRLGERKKRVEKKKVVKRLHDKTVSLFLTLLLTGTLAVTFNTQQIKIGSRTTIFPETQKQYLSIPEDWWDNKWEHRVPIILKNSENIHREQVPVILKLHQIFGHYFDYSSVNMESARIIEDNDEILYLIQDIDWFEGYSDYDLLTFMTDVSANSEKTIWVYYSTNTSINAPTTYLTYDTIINSPVNLLKNPSFELDLDSDGWPDDWYHSQYDSEYELVWDSATSVTGSHSIKVYIRDDANITRISYPGWTQFVEVKPNRNYLYSGFVKLSNSSNYMNLALHRLKSIEPYEDIPDTGALAYVADPLIFCSGQYGGIADHRLTTDWVYALKLYRTKPSDERYANIIPTTHVLGTVWYDAFLFYEMLDLEIGQKEEVTGKVVDYDVWSVSALKKAYPSDSAISSTAVYLGIAKNEYEPFQLVITPYKDLKDVRIEVRNIKNGDGDTLDDITVDLVEYINVTEPNFGSNGAGKWPDPLIPYEQGDVFNVSNYSSKAIWFTVYVPKHQSAGIYSGNITIVPSNADQKTIPITIKIYDFELPVQGHLKTMFGLDCAGWFKKIQYEMVHGEGSWTWEMEQECLNDYRNNLIFRYIENFASHRISPYLFDILETEYNEQTQVLSVNTTVFDEVYDLGIELGLNTIALQECRGGQHEIPWGWSLAGSKNFFTYDYNTSMIQFSEFMANHLDEKGWLDKAMVYTWDTDGYEVQYEARHNETWVSYLRGIYNLIKEGDPRLKVYHSASITPQLYGTIDTWGPCPELYDENLTRERQDLGEDVWYTLDARFGMDVSLTQIRKYPWLCWKHDVHGFETDGSNAWNQNVWKNPKLIEGGLNGDCYLLYPGSDIWYDAPVDHFVPSMRWEIIRESLEDYEYFWLLDKLINRAKAQGINTTDAEIALARVNEMIDGIEFKDDSELLYEIRSQIAREIENLKHLILEGDLNNDGIVNIEDIFIVAKAFQTKPGNEHWDPRADLDGNDLINIADLYEVAKDYGKTV